MFNIKYKLVTDTGIHQEEKQNLSWEESGCLFDALPYPGDEGQDLVSLEISIYRTRESLKALTDN